MSIRNRTTKLIARRHDLNYFKRLSPIRAWQWYLAVVALVCAVAWFASSTLMRGNLAFSSGPISSSHAVFGQKCELCHVPVIAATRFSPAFGRRVKVPDSACLACHTASPHHPAETKETPTCGSCHTEHIGAMHLANTADHGCISCHADLQSKAGMLNVNAHVKNFASEHPEFRPLRMVSDTDKAAIFALRFGHADHMKADLKGPDGRPQPLTCQYCHEAAVNDMGRQEAHIAPVSFEKSCRSCHELDFDRHISQPAPHTKAPEVEAFVIKQIADFAQQHPDVVQAEIRNWPNEPLLPGQLQMPPPKSTQEWISNRTRRAEIVLWREKCELCHKDLNRGNEAALVPAALNASTMPTPMAPGPIMTPNIEPSKQQMHWFRAAVFSHPAHQAVKCEECHTAALNSTSGTDVLMPSIATCRKCHDGESSPQGPPVKTGHAESGCFLCHVYHGDQPGTLAAAHTLAQVTSN